jgi:Domain of unknown function (DUF1942)
MRLANAIAAVVAAAGGIVAAPHVAADGYPIVQQFGSEEIVSTGGNNQGVVGWTVNNLRLSSDSIDLPVQGHLWEATATLRYVRGGCSLPYSSRFNARASNGQDYPELASANASEPMARVCPGGQSTGKLYFDVVGPDPDSVVYRSDFTDLLVWVH